MRASGFNNGRQIKPFISFILRLIHKSAWAVMRYCVCNGEKQYHLYYIELVPRGHLMM